MFVLAFVFIVTICGAASAALPLQSTTTTHTNNTTINSTLQTAKATTNSSGSKGDPIITGTVTINRYVNGTYYPVQGATITVNSTGTNSRILATTTTDKNGNYYIDFYSTAQSFSVTSSYLGCNNITNTVTVTLNSTDGLYYGTSNFTMTPNIATVTGSGDGTTVYSSNATKKSFAGIINVKINNVTYKAFCIDLYTGISDNDNLYENGPLPGTTGSLSNQDNWAAVNYIITNYTPSNNTEAAAMQCAIWYFTSEQYGVFPGNNSTYPGRYQFMTCPTDGITTGGGTNTTVRTLALQIIGNATNGILYPSSINLTPGTIRVPDGGNATVTATVTDQNGNPLSGVTVNFTSSSGSLSTKTGTTNSLGQISTVLSGVANSTSATVNAAVSGGYGSLLYDNPSNPLQNLVATSVLPNTFSASSIVNFDLTANVTLSQTVTTPVNVGNTVTYVLTADNTGTSTATGILINDVAPSGFTVTPSSETTYYNGVWTIPTLANGATATLTITGTATPAMAGTNITNTATRTAEDQYNGMSPTSTINFYTKKASLNITNTATSSPLNVGQTGTFTLTATNNGPDTATNIQITDALPTGFTAGLPTQGTYNPTTGIWTITSLTSGQTASLTFTGPITANMAGTTITNTATATWTEYPGTVTIPNSTIYVKEANVAITQTTSSSPVNVGNTVTYTVTAKNNGPDTATNIVIDDTIPTGFTATPSIGTYTNGVWTIPTLANGTTATLTITGTATPAMAGTSTTNTATRTSQTEYNNEPTTSVSTPIYTKEGNITVTNTATSSPLNVGQTGTFTLTATNNGPDTATNIQITDALPTGFTAGLPTQGTYNPTTGIWTITSLTSGQTASLTFTGPITANMAGTTITNTATATWTEYPGTVTIPNSTIYVKEANVAITQTTSSSPVNVGNTVTYTVTAKNNGPDTATNIVIDDTIPTGFTATPSIGTYTNGVWTIPTLANGTTATLTITGTATPAMAGTSTTNTATRTSQTEYNNEPTTSVSTPIYTKEGNITVTNTATSSPLNVGQTGTFTLTATNNGPDTATNIQITDALPTGFTAGLPTQGTYNPTTGIWTITSLTSGQTASLTFTGPITANMAGTTITNTATATWTEYPGTVTIPNSTIYVKEANVAITQTTSSSPVNVGNTVTYTVTAKNNGPDTATNIVIDDTIPTGFTATPSIGTYTNGVWTIPTLANGTTATLTITGTATPAMAGTSTTNTATRTSQTEYNNEPTTSVSTPIYTKEGNITVTNTATSSPLNVGQTGTFTLTATNNGPDTATNIQITDALPTGFTAGLPTQGTYNPTTGIWTITSLTSGQTASLTFTGPITANMAGTTITNTATATWTEYPGTVTIPNSTIYVKEANVAITQTTSSSPVNVGNTVTYTVTAKNNGPDTATNIVIDDTIPTGFTATPSIGTYTNGVWTIPTLANGTTATLTITGTATPAMAGTSTTNTATRTSQTEYNNEPTTSVSTPIYTKEGNITVTNTATSSPLNVGQTGTFTLTATNNGPDTATNIQITDALPTGFTAGLPTQGTYNPTTGIWTITSLTSGQTASLTFTGPITANMAGTTITNTATATWTEYPGTVTIPNSTIYVKEANVAITQTTSSSPVNVGNTVTYTVTAKNNGPDTATNIVIDDTIPTGFTATPSIGTYTNGVWTIPTLANGTTATLTITGTATPAMAGTSTTNTATRTSQTEYNNEPTTSVSTPIYTKEGNITVTNTATSSPLNVGQTGTFTLTATNNGPDTATNIQITDALPTGFTAGIPTQGTYNPTTGIWTITSLTSGQTASLTFTGPITANMAGTTITNTATATWTEYPGTVTIPNSTIYVKEANVAITQTTSSSPVNVGNTVTYTVTAKNNGPDTATNIVIDDTIPTGFTATPSIGTYTNGVWTIPTLANGTTATLTITGTATPAMAGTSTTNTATRTSQTEYNNEPTTSVSTPIYTKEGNITVTNTATSSPLNVGQTGTFTLTATNNGPDTATNIQITDALPTGFTAGLPTQGTYNPTTGIWTITSLTSGQTASLTFTGPITANMAGTTITNTATATWTEYPGTVTIPNSTIYVKEANVAITQTTSTSPVNVGNPVTYTVTATNNGPDTATNIVIDDTIPTGFTATPSIGTYTNGVWTIPTLANGTTATLTITGNATATMAGTSTTNTATRISQTEYNNEPTTSVSAPIYTKEGNITVTNTATTSPINVGQTGTFTLNVTNNGPDTTTNIKITDALPTGFTAGTPTQGTYNSTTGIWTITSLTSGQTATLTFTGLITSNMAGTNITNNANATWTEYPGTVTIPQATIYIKEANVVLSQTGNYSGNTVTFVVTATNNGPDTATNINILDLIPSGLTGVTITPSIGTYNSTTGIWTINSLLNGTFATLNITGIAVPQSIITNNATRTGQTEYNNEPNTIKLSMYVPDVNIAIYNYPWWYNGDTQSQQYTYVVGNAPVLTTDIWNNGPDDATGVVIEYDMGSGLEYQGCSADIGTVTYNSQNNSLTWDLGNIPNGGDVLLKIFVRITQSGTATPNLTTTSKLIHVDQYDSDTTDNTATCALTAPTAADIQVNQTQNTYTGTNGKKYITYTITTTNNGPDTATGVQITDLLPTGTTYNSSTIPTGTTYNPTTGIWNIGTLNNTNNLTLTITAQITATTGTITNTASESNENEYDPNYANNAQTCSYTISGTYTPTSNIAIYNYPWWYNSDTQSQQYTYVVGNAPVLTTDIWNNGPDDATGVVIEYDMGSGLEYEGCSADIGTVTYNSQNNSLTWDLGNIPNGGDVLLKIFVRITQSGTATPNLTTTSKLIHVDQYDSDTTDNTATCALTAPTAADIQVNQTQNTTTDNNGNQYVTYTITVTNNGPDTATGVQITDLLPTGTTYNSSTIPTGTTYNPTTGIWNIGTLNNTNNLTLTITAQITATTGTITNTATKTNENEYDPNYANDAQTQTLTLQ